MDSEPMRAGQVIQLPHNVVLYPNHGPLTFWVAVLSIVLTPISIACGYWLYGIIYP